MSNKTHCKQKLSTFISQEITKDHMGISGFELWFTLYTEGISYETKMNGLHHSISDHPSIIHFYFTDKTTFKCWHCNGIVHRTLGPAKIINTTEQYFYYGKKCSKSKVMQMEIDYGKQQ